MSQWTPADQRLDVPYNENTKFVCIEHPALVKNPDKALATLGGVEGVSEAYSNLTQKLALRWRPEDVFCKPTFGEIHRTTSLLLRVKRRKKKNSTQPAEFKAEMLGTISSIYKFQGMTDFQYLAMDRQADGKYRNIYDDIVLSDMVDRKEYFSRDVPLFLPPVVFSRQDLPYDFMYRCEMERPPDKNPDASRPAHLIGTVRKKRSIYTIFVNYGEDLPTEPIPEAKEKLKSNFLDPKWAVEVRELLEVKPLWLKTELEHRISIHPDKLKLILPNCCFYWLDGPWRAQWNKFGFDPTKNPSAKLYQTLDYRIRHMGLQYWDVKAKRTDSRPPMWGHNMRTKPQVAFINFDSLGTRKKDNSSLIEDTKKELLYEFWPNRIPVQRLTYYQLGSIHIDEVQALVHQNDGKETVCTERDGWCIENICRRCRTIMSPYTERLLDKGVSLEDKFAKKLKSAKAAKLKDQDEDVEDEEEEEEELGEEEDRDEEEEEEMDIDQTGGDNLEDNSVDKSTGIADSKGNG